MVEGALALRGGRVGSCHIPGTTEVTRDIDRTLYVLYILLVHSLCVTMATNWSTPI